MKYSIAIRTLGTSGDKFVAELESIKRQTVQPDKVVVYIAEGYERPEYTIGKEEYVWVKKGMMRQRVLRYDEIETPLILLLDDDVELADDTAERMINALKTHDLDCLGADVFKNQDMSLKNKLYAIVTNLVFPHWSKKWAFKIHSNGSFSYNNHVTKDVYLSQSAAGPAALWRKQTFLDLHLDDELWLERFGFPYAEDALMYNKLYRNGYKLGINYESGIKNLDGKSSSADFQKNPKKFYTRAMASLMVWHRTCYNLKSFSFFKKVWVAFCFTIKVLWLLIIHALSALVLRSPKVLTYYISGIIDGLKIIKTQEYKQIPDYILN